MSSLATASNTLASTSLTACALQDLTDLPRTGFRGAHSAEYLQARGFTLPGAPNRATPQQDGCQVARLSQTEYLLLGSPLDGGERIADEEARWELDHQANYLLPRQDSHAWLQLSGRRISEVMAKLCGVDLHPRAFGPGAVAQTSAARINVIVINTGSDLAPCFELLFDRCSLDYFKAAVLDAMSEFD
ncbi:sarcosine oxidase subunit gamma family protein [Pseudomonas sp. DTU_2021_1001937_2_SI_NGA_ILE_001]|uniref:sarcosine oxidase subunit gamma n=1 Tax=Pseudomonas sp. DTU_2021_1001937_2_SI_NGA_ILE_001 TaxID=3077589 RepID=UPI0028FC1794|nr:sarcosine oxidase subunit gamma family protein [Pseudomonas sp. DTU_2021_1001937_2_SI_NGA_ILE_001]WNW10597.1 sarcosine oxidase subunit gamma family protein [Pseudomonas sp. DTU_2021_1001937_2_SI_NGA_ILE_001]